jgi:oxygen-independent coproporphyrinogen-3 oxidase
VATVRHRKPENWLGGLERARHGIAEERVLGAAEQASEAMLMGLRLREGVDLGEMASRFGMAEAQLCNAAKARFYEQQGFVWRQGSRLGVTEQGMVLLDALLGELVPEQLVEG